MVNYFPRRGDFILLNFDPQAGHEQMGTRPALVVSQDQFNRKMGFVFVCPISNTARKNPFYVPIPSGQPVTGVIMTDQLRSLDYRARKASFIAECQADLFEEVLRRIKPILY
ncbi:MAG TPA: potassium-transporting ATPase subunit C [Cyanobacteria bacterium UBA12227]|nr:potassium-transporting ATPase subunit C [Cyanobacteria bacterium UBA12227]HAX88653.1 potassium-transporting ATPase subunit C [Cyanobacteria bacterium UBA11370]HBY81790.1 potassium-transporting ATPase subunit C [Cyanobacteria bacterium UBA11148]